MSTEAIAAPTTRPRATLSDLVIRGVAWALVATCLVLLGTILVAGERAASYADLRAAVADGRVDEIRVEGGLDDGVIGASATSVHWRDGLMGRVTTLTEASSRRQAANAGGRVVVGQVDEQLRELDPDLRTARSDRRDDAELGPWRVPAWMEVASIVIWLGAFGILVAGRDPWRANRWAWLWVITGLPIVGVLVFLLLGGPTSLLRPGRPERRLTGGWAFLLTMVLRGAGAAAIAAFL